MKVLYIGCYKDGTGWASSAQQNILALDSVDVEVVPRALKLNDTQGQVPKRILELEKKSTDGCDVVIQNVLPHHMVYDGHFKKNIACYLTETSNFSGTSWPERLNLMDEGWVSCGQMINAARESHVKIPLHVLPVPCDVSRYQQKYEPFPELLPKFKDKFVFYTIGEVTKRKNLIALLRAFHTEFQPDEDVELLIKGNIPGSSAAQTMQHIEGICEKTKTNLKLYPNTDQYKREMIVSQYWTDEQVMRLHSMCHCFVMPSYGEAWCLPAFDAMAMGKTPICTDVGAMSEFLKYREYAKVTEWEYAEESVLPGMHHPTPISYGPSRRPIVYENICSYSPDNSGKRHPGISTDYHDWHNLKDGGQHQYCGYLVRSTTEPCFSMLDTFPDLGTANENWAAIDINALRAAMREAYTNKEDRAKRAENGINRAYDYSHQAVGKLMLEALNG